ncbi:MAG: hypothetical protein JXO22_15300 [Phycisphaerae bacterium]|nr:hypothetical protein [Phycisphaerae bacterium]
MSFEPAGTLHSGHCLFCNLGCALCIGPFGPQRWRTHVGGNGQGTGKLCARGHMLCDLLHHAARVYRPSAVGGMTAAIDQLASLIADTADARLSIWLDGNVAVEDLAAARALCEQRPNRTQLLVHLPSQELGAADGFDAAGVAQASPASWDGADTLLVVGNPLVTHPPVARHLMRWGAERAKTPLVVIDSSAGLLSGFTPHHIVCRPGYEYWVLVSLLADAGFDAASISGPAESDLGSIIVHSGVDSVACRRAATALRAAKRPAAIIAPQAGGMERWRAVSFTAASWAKARGGMASVLTGSANTVAMARYMRRHGIRDWVSAAEEGRVAETDVLMVIGWDPSSAYPRSLWEPAVRRAAHVVMAAAFPPTDADWVHQLLPLAMNVEAGGTYVLVDGSVSRLEALLPPPSGVPTVRELLSQLSAALTPAVFSAPTLTDVSISGADVAVGAPRDVGPPVPPPVAAPEGWPAALVADSTQYADGQMTRQARWVQQLGNLPELWLSPQEARVLELVDGQTASIMNERGAADVQVVVAYDRPDFGGCYSENVIKSGRPVGWVVVNGTSPAVRKLAAGRYGTAEEAAQAGAIYVRVQKGGVAAIRREAAHVGG